LSEIGFAGASFGVFTGLAPLDGMLFFTMISAVAVGEMATEQSRREAAIAAISSLFMGLGILFLSLANKSASYATNILFGSIIGISVQEVWQLVVLSIIMLIVMFFAYRYLVFDSFDSVGARVQRLPKHLLSILFLLLLAISVSIGAQIVGSLLVFVLLTLPASSARYLVHTVPRMILVSVILALAGVWGGLVLGYYTNWPVTFFIATIEVVIYLGTLLWDRRATGD
jgi:zinc/manganese transport system permease protein